MDDKIANNYEYAYIRRKSGRMYVGKNPKEYPPDDEIIEARFFGAKGEYLVLPDYDIERKTDFTGSDDNVIEREYKIENKEHGSSLTVKFFVERDEDGQAVIRRKCLCGWKGAENG